jgi:GT2 family glycosyltransferase
MKNSVTVVILSWNGKEDTLRCLDSLRAVSPAPRIILVDNGSTDQTSSAVREIYPEVEIIRSEENLGFPAGNNLGIEAALRGGASYICLLNNDTAVDPLFLRELLAAAREHPDAGVLGSRIYYYSRPRVVWSQGISVRALTGRVYTTFYNRPESEVPENIRPARAVSAAALLFRSEVAEKIGLLDENYFLCYEDADYCLRARRAGFRVYTVPASRVRHRISSSMGGEGSATIIYYSTRNHLFMMNKCLPLPALLRPARNLLIMLYNLLFVVVTSRTPVRSGIPTWWRGVRDYFAGRMGKVSFHPE